jgi:hypothetical protein
MLIYLNPALTDNPTRPQRGSESPLLKLSVIETGRYEWFANYTRIRFVEVQIPGTEIKFMVSPDDCLEDSGALADFRRIVEQKQDDVEHEQGRCRYVVCSHPAHDNGLPTNNAQEA